MTFEQLLGILKIPSLLKIDTEKKIITITTPILTIGPISYSSAKSFIKDTSSITKFLNKTFVQRMVMWHDFKKEHIEWSRKSLEEVAIISQDFYREIDKNQNSKDGFLLEYLVAFESECILAAKAIKEAERDEREQRDSFLPLDDIFFAKEQMEFILKDFRNKTYPMIKALSRILPESNIVRKQVEDKLKMGADLLRIKIQDIMVDGLE